jgi:hypothetical protein
VSTYCTESCCLHCQNISHILPMWYVSRYGVSIYAIYILSVSSRMLLMWSECLTICCTDSYCPHGQSVSQCIAHVVRVHYDMRCQSVLSTFSVCVSLYIATYCHVRSRILPMWLVCVTMCCIDSYCSHCQNKCHILPRGQNVSRHIAFVHVVSMYRHISRSMVSVCRMHHGMCITVYCCALLCIAVHCAGSYCL